SPSVAAPSGAAGCALITSQREERSVGGRHHAHVPSWFLAYGCRVPFVLAARGRGTERHRGSEKWRCRHRQRASVGGWRGRPEGWRERGGCGGGDGVRLGRDLAGSG